MAPEQLAGKQASATIFLRQTSHKQTRSISTYGIPNPRLQRLDIERSSPVPNSTRDRRTRLSPEQERAPIADQPAATGRLLGPTPALAGYKPQTRRQLPGQSPPTSDPAGKKSVAARRSRKQHRSKRRPLHQTCSAVSGRHIHPPATSKSERDMVAPAAPSAHSLC